LSACFFFSYCDKSLFQVNQAMSYEMSRIRSGSFWTIILVLKIFAYRRLLISVLVSFQDFILVRIPSRSEVKHKAKLQIYSVFLGSWNGCEIVPQIFYSELTRSICAFHIIFERLTQMFFNWFLIMFLNIQDPIRIILRYHFSHVKYAAAVSNSSKCVCK
jgi:hypothetical protein